MRELAYIMFITNNHASFYLGWEEHLLKYQKSQNILIIIVVTKSNDFFKDVWWSWCITEKEIKYFSYEYEKIINRGKFLRTSENP